MGSEKQLNWFAFFSKFETSLLFIKSGEMTVFAFKSFYNWPIFLVLVAGLFNFKAKLSW